MMTLLPLSCFITSPRHLLRHEAFSAMETAATCTKCVGSPPQQRKPWLSYKLCTTLLYQIQDQYLLLFTKSPDEWVQGVYSISNSAQLRACWQQFGSSSTAELPTAWGKRCRKRHFPGSWAESGANLPRITEILPNNI